ncbi:MAG: hypothetical protein QG556_173, partial [Pseudomonadota bacterium]|nr:hypothetical protein [Pseudomonadota bacterium]
HLFYQAIETENTHLISNFYEYKPWLFEIPLLDEELPGFNAIYIAILKRKFNSLKQIEQLGLDFQEPILNILNFNPIHFGSWLNVTFITSLFHKLNISLNTPIQTGNFQDLTLAHLATIRQNTHVLHFLQQNNIDLNQSIQDGPYQGMCPFDFAIQEKQLELSMFFTVHGCIWTPSINIQHINFLESVFNQTTKQQLQIQAAIEVQNLDKINAYYQARPWFFYASIIQGFFKGFNLIHLATFNQSLEVLERFHQLNLDFRKTSKDDAYCSYFEPINLCFAHKDTKILQFFHELNIPLDTAIEAGPHQDMTLADLAAKNGNILILTYLNQQNPSIIPEIDITEADEYRPAKISRTLAHHHLTNSLDETPSHLRGIEHYWISDKEKMQTFCKIRNLNYVAQTKQQYIKHEKSMYLAQCAKLSQGSHNQFYGIYTAKDIPEGIVLGEYLGERITSKQADEKAQKGHNISYNFNIDKRYVIDGLIHRSWTAFINSCSCYEQGNVEVYLSKDKSGSHLLFKSKKPIQSHEQLLYYYGYDYEFDANLLRFLNPRDSFLESQDIYTQNKQGYQETATIDASLCEHLNIPTDSLFLQPKIDTQDANLPLLQLNDKQKPISQYAQENLTPLMIACWLALKTQIQKLIRRKALIDMQASISGKTAIEFLILSPHTTESIKLQILKQLVNVNNAHTLVITSQTSFSAIYYAIEQKHLNIVKYLIEEFNHLCHFHELRDDEDRSISDYAKAIDSQECSEYLQENSNPRKRKSSCI